MGDRTYGTASQQKWIELEDGSALILTVANYYTPSGKEIPVDGVSPTVLIQPAPADSVAQLDENYSPSLSTSVSPDDVVVRKAIEVLQGNGTTLKKAA